MSGLNTHLTRVVCWTRMQAESGQDIASIIARKEIERKVGGGMFFWGVGNAPSRSTGRLAINGEEVDVVFSLMKGRPAPRDTAPSGVVAWRTYFDSLGVERPLPRHVLVTSRMETVFGVKSVHYALVCWSVEELRLGDHGAFDPSAYCNLGSQGAAGHSVGSCQVTALVVRTHDESPVSNYRINLRAKLAGGYWVRLADRAFLGKRHEPHWRMPPRVPGKSASASGSGWFPSSGLTPRHPSKSNSPCFETPRRQGASWKPTVPRSRNG